MKFLKFNQRGHLHLVVPLIVVVVIAVVGGVTYKAVSKAASSVTGCVATTYQSGNKDSGSSHCVQYIQQMFNGVDAYMDYTNLGATKVNAVSTSALDSSEYFLVNGNFGSTTNSYDANTVSGVKGFQTWVNANGTVSGKSYSFGLSSTAFASAFKPNGALTVSGSTDSKTWYALCRAVNKIPSSDMAVTDSTDYSGGGTTTKTTMWYIRSYMRTASTAASDANCSGVLSGSSSTTTPPVAPTGVKASTTSGNLVITWTKATGATKYTVAVLNSAKASISLPNSSVTGTSATIDKPTVIKGDSAGTGYVEVRSCNANTTDACGGWSSQVAFRLSGSSTTTPPVAPTGVKASTTSGNLVITWTKATGATKYEVVPLTTSGATIAVPNNYVTVTSATFDKATITKVASSGSVEVRSCNASTTDACGGWSTKAAFSFSGSTSSGSTAVPAAPSGVSMSTASGAAVLTWSAPSGVSVSYYNSAALNSSGTAITVNHQLGSTARSATYDKGTVETGDYAEVRDCNTASPTVCSAWVKEKITF